ncbi:hypothetical protein C8T65DRAFT_645860 [Cerioporus squamosus]|nr:hypothetical protein C8T65DRAFT_645860 [Cerioporus squamosus]
MCEIEDLGNHCVSRSSMPREETSGLESSHRNNRVRRACTRLSDAAGTRVAGRAAQAIRASDSNP